MCLCQIHLLKRGSDGIGKWGLWDVIRTGRGLIPLQKRPEKLPLSLLPSEDRRENQPSATQKQAFTMLAPGSLDFQPSEL